MAVPLSWFFGGEVMKRSCPYCGKVHDSRFDCGARPKRKKRAGERERFRSSAAWTEKSAAIRERDLFLCRVCLAEGVLQWEGLSVHHIVPLSEDFDRRLDDENLITLCEKHHKQADRGSIEKAALFALAKASPPPGETAAAGRFLQDHTAPAEYKKFPK